MSNLEWVTTSENQKHALRIGLKKYKKIKMINPTTNEIRIFNNSYEVEKYFNKKIWFDTISRCCNGKRKTAYKMKWQYVEN